MQFTRLTLALTVMLIAPVSASADGLMTTLVKDTLHITGDAVGGTVGLVGGAVGAAGNVVSGTVDSVGNVIDGSGRIVGRVITPDQLPAGNPHITTYGGTTLLGVTNDVYGYSIDTRYSDLAKAVDAAESAGKLSNGQATQLRQELAAILTNESNAKADHVMSFDESLAVAKQLDNLNTELASMISVQPFGQLVMVDTSGNSRIFVTTPRTTSSTSTSIVSNNDGTTATRTVANDDGTTSSVTTTTTTSGQPMSSAALFSLLDNRRYELDKKIGNAKISGAIAGEQAESLQAKSDHIRLLLLDRESALNHLQASKVAQELDALDADVATALNVPRMTPLTVPDTTNSSQRIVSTQYGNVIGISEAGPDIYIKTIDTRRAELEAQIAAGQAAGKIAEQQARNLRAELERVAQLQAAEKAGQYTYVTALPLAMSLDYVGNQLVGVIPTTTYVPLIDGTRFVVYGGRIVMLDDIMVRRAELEMKISRMLANGNISAKQASTLRVELGNIAVIESKMRAKGAFSYKDSKDLYTAFDHVGSQLDSYRHASGGRSSASTY